MSEPIKPDFACNYIPRRPWVLSRQYGMTFILSADNEIIIGAEGCKKMGEDVARHIVAAVNKFSEELKCAPRI